MLADGMFAVAQEPASSPWRDTALCMQGEALLLAGDVDQATAVFAEASSVAAAMSNTDSLVDSEAELAVLAMDRGRWAEAAEHVERAIDAIDETRLHDYVISVLAFAGAARLAVHRGDLNEANRRLTQAMRARPSLTFAIPYLAVRARLQMAKVYWAIGDRMAARHLLRRDRRHLDAPAELWVSSSTRSRSSAPTVTSAPLESGSAHPSPLTPAELRLLPYLQTHLSIREIAARLFVSRNTVNSEVTSIYRKLGVSSRSEAVQQATTIGLLGS